MHKNVCEAMWTSVTSQTIVCMYVKSYLNKLWQTIFGERCDDIGGDLVAVACEMMTVTVNDDAGICASADCTTITYPMAKYERARKWMDCMWFACNAFSTYEILLSWSLFPHFFRRQSEALFFAFVMWIWHRKFGIFCTRCQTCTHSLFPKKVHAKPFADNIGSIYVPSVGCRIAVLFAYN